jgi:uncharacterized protein
MELTRYLKVYTCTDKPGRVLLYGTRRCALLEVSEALLERARTGRLAEQEQKTLAQLGFLVSSHTEEREEVRTSFDRVNRGSRTFNAIVTLTLDCNLSCPYCYEDSFRGQYAMNIATADLLVAKLTGRMAASLAVSVSFYGGEALMALPVLKRIAAKLGEAAREKSVAFDFNIVTNGTLLNRKIVEELLPLGLNGAKLTIDGPQDIHDQQRPFVSGKGSFDLIVSNIKETSGLLPLQVGGNYTRHNYRRFPDLLDFFLAEGITPDKLRLVFFSPVTPRADGSTASGDVSSVCACTEEPWMIEASLFLREEILKRGFATQKLRPSGCMIEFENELVVGYDGGLYKCPAFMGDESLRIGSLADGAGDYSQSHGLDVWKCDECLDCPYLPLCFGGCRFLRRLRTGDMDGVDCRQTYLDATLEQIILQDMALRAKPGP